jgi:co-chaperonin GroES (HSP10)|tara:strand:- start:125 stop:547 length:423 start_codon:yes stop_codon:yes gene_type:complete
MKAAGVATAAAGNDEWISNKEVKDPEVLPHIPGYHVLIRPVAIREKTKGGILLPDKFKDDAKYLTTVGRVLKVGELAYADRDRFKGGSWCKPGDYVVYGKYQGDKFSYQGIKMILLFDDQILMVIPNPGDLDPTYLDVSK